MVCACAVCTTLLLAFLSHAEFYSVYLKEMHIVASSESLLSRYMHDFIKKISLYLRHISYFFKSLHSFYLKTYKRIYIW